MRLQRLATKAIARAYTEWRFLSWEINRKFRKYNIISTKQGIYKILFADNDISKQLYCYGQYQIELITNALIFLRGIHKCPPKGEGSVIDIGANIGIISIGMLHAGQVKQAIAIEPDPQNYSLLQENVALNGLKERIVCLPVAASYQKGETQFELSDDNFGDHRINTNFHQFNSDLPELFNESKRNIITVQTDQLDNLLARSPDSFTRNIALMWVDVQGYEGYVFMGARSTLSTGIPVVSEIWPYGIKRSGMNQDEFCSIVSSIWSNYWVWRRGKFICYPINTIDIFFDELGYEGAYDDVIFTI